MTRKPNDVGDAPEPQLDRGSPAAWGVSAGGVAVEAVVLAVMACWSAYGVVSGNASTTTRALTEAVVLLVLAAGLGVLVRNLLLRKPLAKTPTLLWNVMLLPVGYSLITGGAPWWGAGAVVVALVTIGAALCVPRYDLDAAD